MAREAVHRLLNDQSGATAAVFGLSLFALIAIGGVGFDYARLAGMDSELQNAADQAALAAASQLDGRTGTCMRASAAATSLVANMTLLANDGGGQAITIAAEPDCDATGNIRFWRDKAKTQAATSDANAHFVEVRIAARTARYAFTPLVAAFSGDADAAALAGLGSAICKVPPVMMCNPAETADPNFNINYNGRGMRLIADGSYVPGNFGFLANGSGNGAQELAETLGRAAPPGNCVAINGVTTEPGVMSSVRDALNTRFDIYANGLNNACGQNDALCPSAVNVRKDVIMVGGGNGGGNGNGNGGGNGNGNGGLTCSFGNGNNGWQLPPEGKRYLPPSAAPLSNTAVSDLAPMGYPRDMCHAVSDAGSCSNGRIGDGNWDRNAYFRSNSAAYGATGPSSGDLLSWFGTETPTRYTVYEWESRNAATRLASQSLPANGGTAHGAPVCAASSIAPTSTVPDRRVLTVAVINCQAQSISGRRTGVTVTKWMDVFLVEPSLPRPRTDAQDVYVEIIGETRLAGGGGTTGNTVRRDVPYLIE